jgi:hypothetical protein
MGLAGDLTSEVKGIFRSAWSVRDGELVPDTPDIKLGNEGVNLDATVLYADIDGSTDMVDSKTARQSSHTIPTSHFSKLSASIQANCWLPEPEFEALTTWFG